MGIVQNGHCRLKTFHLHWKMVEAEIIINSEMPKASGVGMAFVQIPFETLPFSVFRKKKKKNGANKEFAHR